MNIEERERERDANYFAMCLLIPESWIRKELKGGVDIADDRQLAKLAKKYGVPRLLMAMRIAQLDIDGP